MAEKRTSPIYTQNRELSWLRFNERVLLEALDEQVPLLERLKFVSIFTSNLDEFFMIRVGSLWDLSLVKGGAVDNKTGLSAKEQLDAIFSAVRPLIAEKDDICRQLNQLLAGYGITCLHPEELDKGDQKFLRQYFQNEIDPILSPQIIDSHHPFPHLANKVLHIGALLQDKSKAVFGVIPVPAPLPEVVFLPGGDVRYVSTAELILFYADRIFKPYAVSEKVIFCITRNADIVPGGEAFEEDFRSQMKKLLRQRTKLAPVRLELSHGVSGRFTQYFCEKLQLEKKQLYTTSSPMQMRYAFSLADKLPQALRQELTDPPFSPQLPAGLTPKESILRQVLKRDLLLSYPYESMEPFLQMLREAAADPAVLSIKITIYRLASTAKLVEYLAAAAENGKEVTAVIELSARFDEENNLHFAEKLREAGCNIIYGMGNYKVHSKIVSIVLKKGQELAYITHLGTGNYNESTAKQYTDLNVITANEEIGEDAVAFFRNIGIGNTEFSYKHLLVAPETLKAGILARIDGEIAKAQAGGRGVVAMKMNSLTDKTVIDKLVEASCAGVQIELLVRGICCLRPGVEGKTENIAVTSVVGRFLEHSRIYSFGEGEERVTYISSADMMTRNTDKRVEIAAPVLDREVEEQVYSYLRLMLSDNVKAMRLCSDGVYRPVGREEGEPEVNGQEACIAAAREKL